MTSSVRHRIGLVIPFVIVGLLMWRSTQDHQLQKQRNDQILDDREVWMDGMHAASEAVRDDRFTMTNFHEFVAANPHLEIKIPDFTPLEVSIPDVPRRLEEE